MSTTGTTASSLPSLPSLRNFSNPKLTGYPATANIMGSFSEMAIFRRFKSAGALDLLYRQADLQHYFEIWKQAVAAAQVGGLSLYDTSFAERGLSMLDPDKTKGTQVQAWNEISSRLEKYYEALLRYQKICNLPEVDKHSLRMLHLHLNADAQGGSYLEECEADIYGPPGGSDASKILKPDFTSIAEREEEDFFTKFARGPAVKAFHKAFGIDHRDNIQAIRLTENEVVEYPYKHYATASSTLFAGILYCVLTSLLVMAAILSLSSVRSFHVRVFLILLYNLLFTVAMAFSVKGKPKDFFGVAAAYAAVLVVFANSPSSQGSSTHT